MPNIWTQTCWFNSDLSIYQNGLSALFSACQCTSAVCCLLFAVRVIGGCSRLRCITFIRRANKQIYEIPGKRNAPRISDPNQNEYFIDWGHFWQPVTACNSILPFTFFLFHVPYLIFFLGSKIWKKNKRRKYTLNRFRSIQFFTSESFHIIYQHSQHKSN